MAQIIVDPKELRRFARHLEQVISELRSKKLDTSSHFLNLKETWRDPRYAQFEKTYDDALQRLEQFFKLAGEYIRFLDMKAAKAERFLERH